MFPSHLVLFPISPPKIPIAFYFLKAQSFSVSDGESKESRGWKFLACGLASYSSIKNNQTIHTRSIHLPACNHSCVLIVLKEYLSLPLTHITESSFLLPSLWKVPSSLILRAVLFDKYRCSGASNFEFNYNSATC